MKKELSLYSILRRILTELNAQVIEHGERVAFMYLKMIEYCEIEDNEYIEKMMLACLAHDIGAYKTNKFLSLLRFDAENTLEHCIYGYLFMKYFSPLKEDSEVFLYHHTFYEEKKNISSKYFDDGVLIHLLDRIDILNISCEGNEDAIIKQIVDNKGTIFNPKDVDNFIYANKKFNIINKLNTNQFDNEVKKYFDDPKRFDRLLEPIINMLAFEVDFKSEQTVIHTVTTALFSKALAEKFNLSEEDTNNLFLAAKLHDLGKIKVPTNILEKPGRLTPEEYDVIKKHVFYTDDIIKDLFQEEVTDIACKHHERLDGSGYPNGLKAQKLTIQDRILQVADVASALIYKRSYKAAMEKDVVLSILDDEKKSGRLDEDVVNIFEQHYDDILKETSLISEPIINEYENLQHEFKEYSKEYSELNHVKDDFGLLSINESKHDKKVTFYKKTPIEDI